MIKKSYLFLTLLTALLWLGSGTMWGEPISIDADHPYSNNFESNIDGFSKVGYSSATITKNSTSGKVNGTYALRVYTYSTNNVVLIFPEFDDALENLSVSFYAARTYNATTSIGYITNVSSASTFVSKQSFSCSTGIGGPYSYDFSTAGSIPAGARIAISYSGQSSKSSYLFIDDLTVTSTTTASACKKPKNLTQGTVTTTSASFTWAQGASEEAWQYVCLPASATLDWTGATTVTSASATVSGLTAGTSYRFYVRSDCGSEQSGAASAEFKTIYALPFSESFTGLTAGIPAGWDNSEGTTTTETYKWSYYNAGYGAVPCLRFNSYSNGYKTNFLKSPTIYVDKAATLSFAYKNPKGGAFAIYYTIDGGSQQTLKTGYPQVSDWTEYDEDLPAACIGHNVQIIFKGTSNNGSGDAYLYLDDISVTEASSCAKPTVVNASAASDSKINLSWTKGESETQWNVQYSSDGGTSWTAVNNIATTVDGANCSASLTGLAEQTTYQIQVQADCGGALSKWVSFGGVPTPCTAKSFPFSEDFTGLTSGNIPECWNNYEGTTTTASSKWVYYSSGHDAAPCVRFDSYNNSNGNTNFLKTPNVAVTENAIVNFWYKNPAGGDFSVYYSIDGAERVLLASGLTGQTDWKEESYLLPAAAVGHNVMIIFKGTSNYGSGTAYIFLDDVEIKAAPSCAKPTEVVGVATAYNQATISWTENNGKSAWKLQYSSDNGVNWSDEISVSENPYTLTGLAEKTNYIVHVKTVCGVSEESDWSANSDAFPTPCEPVDASDYSENFENATVGSGNLADCWQYKDVYTYLEDDYPYVYNSGAYQGSKALYFYGGGSESVNTVVLPAMDEALNGLTVEFYYNTSVNAGSVVYASPVLGYIAADGTTFVDIETLDQSADYILYKKDLSSVPATAKNIAISYANGTAGSGHMYLDNVRVYPTPSCVDPSGVTVSNVTATTADVAWAENNGANVWKLQVSNDGTNWSDVNGGADITTNPYTLTGLTANHATYYVRVKSICGVGDESPWSAASAAFYTECESRSIPWNADFNAEISGEVPGCWAVQDANISGYPSIKVSMGNTYLSLENNGLFFNGSNAHYGYILFPEFVVELNSLQISFSHKVEDATSSGKIELGYFKNNEFTLLKAYDKSESWKTEIFALKTVPSGARLAFRYKGASSYEYAAAVDNIFISELPLCQIVDASTLAASDVTANSATVAWTAANEETAWNLQYKADGGEWSSVIPVATTPSYELTGLAANTLYFVRVQANCGGDGASEYTADDAFSFRTDCEAIAVSKASPWNYGFEVSDGVEVNTIPSCWAELPEGHDNYTYALVANYNQKTGDQCLEMEAYSKDTKIAVLPVFSEEIKNLQIAFAYNNTTTNSNYGHLELGYVKDDAFTRVGDFYALTDGYVAVPAVEMPADAPNGARIAFRLVGIKSYYYSLAYIDDIQVSLKPSCYTPKDLTAVATSTGAALTWAAGKDEAAWQVRYKATAAEDWTLVDAEIASPAYDLTGLTVDVEYEAQVRAYCDELDQSEWSASANFTPVCSAPTALAVMARTANSATFSWTSSESSWTLQYSTDGENWESANVAANPFTLEGLTSGQAYQAKIQSACGSAFSNVVEFTTWCAAISDLPMNEDFENVATNALPACWEKISDGDYPSVVQGSASYEGENGKCLCFFGVGTQIAVMPAFSVELDEYTLSFFYKNANATLELGYINNAGEFVLLQALDAQSAYGDDAYQFALSNELTNKNLAIRYVGMNSMSSKAYLDVVRISKSLVLADNVNNSAALAANEGQTLDVQIGRTIICADYFNTICLPFDLPTLDGTPLEGGELWAFKYAKVDEATDELLFRIIESDHIEAGVPYFISFPAGDNIVSPIFKNVTIAATAGQKVGSGDIAQLCGIIDQPVVFEPNDQTKLFLAANNTLYWWAGTANSQLNNFRAYFKVNTNSGANNAPRHGMRARIIKNELEEQVATGMENVQGENQSLKLLENGQVVIIRNGKKYNAAGQLVK